LIPNNGWSGIGRYFLKIAGKRLISVPG
jgi:hypothetical protein